MGALWFQTFFAIVKKIGMARRVPSAEGLKGRNERLKDFEGRVMQVTVRSNEAVVVSKIEIRVAKRSAAHVGQLAARFVQDDLGGGGVPELAASSGIHIKVTGRSGDKAQLHSNGADLDLIANSRAIAHVVQKVRTG